LEQIEKNAEAACDILTMMNDESDKKTQQIP